MNSLADAIQPRGCKLGGGEVIVSAPVVSRSKAAHLLYAVEEALHEITLTVAPAAEAESLLSTDLCGRALSSCIVCNDRQSSFLALAPCW